jgi:DNA-directed RNA polymerase specialized sigma subunit
MDVSHHYILVEVKYCRDTDRPSRQQRERASQQHQVLREIMQKYVPQATVDQVTLMLGVSGVIRNLQLNHRSLER